MQLDDLIDQIIIDNNKWALDDDIPDLLNNYSNRIDAILELVEELKTIQES